MLYSVVSNSKLINYKKNIQVTAETKAHEHRDSYPFSQVNQTAWGGLKQDWGAIGDTGESQLSKWSVELHALIRHLFDFLTEAFEGQVQLVPKFSLCLQQTWVYTV